MPEQTTTVVPQLTVNQPLRHLVTFFFLLPGIASLTLYGISTALHISDKRIKANKLPYFMEIFPE